MKSPEERLLVTQPEGAPLPGLTKGRIVWYRLTESDARVINARRDSEDVGGNGVEAGEECVMVIVKVWDKVTGTVNGRVLLDGHDSPYWVTSRTFGSGEGQWQWIPQA